MKSLCLANIVCKSEQLDKSLLNQLHIIIVHESQWMTSRNLQLLYPSRRKPTQVHDESSQTISMSHHQQRTS